jgi:hypothetical protein
LSLSFSVLAVCFYLPFQIDCCFSSVKNMAQIQIDALYLCAMLWTGFFHLQLKWGLCHRLSQVRCLISTFIAMLICTWWRSWSRTLCVILTRLCSCSCHVCFTFGQNWQLLPSKCYCVVFSAISLIWSPADVLNPSTHKLVCVKHMLRVQRPQPLPSI